MTHRAVEKMTVSVVIFIFDIGSLAQQQKEVESLVDVAVSKIVLEENSYCGCDSIPFYNRFTCACVYPTQALESCYVLTYRIYVWSELF